MPRLKGWATNSAKQPSILRTVCSLKNPIFRGAHGARGFA